LFVKTSNFQFDEYSEPKMQSDGKMKSGPKFFFLVIGTLIAVLCGMLFLPYHKQQPINFIRWHITPYDDRYETTFPGNSELLSIEKDSSKLAIRYILNKGFTYPYAGISIFFNDSTGRYLDCSRFDGLKISIASAQQSDCKLYLKVFDPNISKANDPLSERYLKKDLLLTSTQVTQAIPFSQLVTPEWWYQKNNITFKNVSAVDFSKVTSIQIESGSTAKLGVIDTLTISGLYLTRHPSNYAIALVTLLLATAIGYAVFRGMPRNKKNPIIITYDKKDIQSYQDIDAQRISEYLAKHFSEPEISIGSVGSALGLSQKKMAKVMNDEFKMSFKQYITSIRIHEAKRLLKETDRLVIDIALKVGFNNISHFNRVFKTLTLVSPLEFRNSNID
jgi:AraC-like DNA-binding protein